MAKPQAAPVASLVALSYLHVGGPKMTINLPMTNLLAKTLGPKDLRADKVLILG